jgi:serine/threonine-protein kinase
MKPIGIGDVVGDYRVIEIAGSGGMGAVYKIEHRITKRIEAMKRLPPGTSSDPEHVRRFEREIQVQARLHHPNIVALYNAVRDGDSIALVMEYVEGESLQRKLETGPLTVATAVDFAGQVLGALACAHDAGVIHRDVAPSNIIITPDGIAKLTDFGLARGATDLRLSTSGAPVGSPWYMSPEQVRGIGELDARTDLYAVGAVLHEMLTGGKLFEAEGAFAVMRAHVEAAPAPPSSRNPEVPAALDEIVCKAVAKDPAKRFQSADEFRLALDSAVAAGRPLVAPSGPPPSARARWLHPSRAAALIALAPAALAAGIYTIRFLPPAPRPAAPAPPAMKTVPQAYQVLPVPAPELPAARPRPVRRRKPLRAAARRRARKAAPGYAIRVKGGEPPPGPAHRWTAAVSEPAVPVTAQPAESPAVLSIAPEPARTSAQEAVPAKPPNAGNRFVRALGKVNPFRRSTKHDAGNALKTPLKKD